MRFLRGGATGLFLFVLALVFGGLAATGGQKGDRDALMKAAEEVVNQVVKLRGLAPKAPIEKGISSREEISRYVRNNIDEMYREEELEREDWLLKKLGLIPDDLDYREFAIALLTEQVGGYYDPRQKTLFIADWLPLEEQLPVMAHELTHALQDQHFNLENLIEKDRALDNEDRFLAHQAFIEGDAVAVMVDYILVPLGRTFTELPDMTLLMRLMLESMNTQFAVLESAPDFVKETLIFPYSYGPTFLKKIRSEHPSWSAVDAVYADLPSSTEQILHPEKYLDSRDEPTAVETAHFAQRLGDEWKVTYKNVFGEFSFYLLLKLYLGEGEAKRAAAGWDGDQVLMIDRGRDGKRAIIAESVWDDEEEAEEFYISLSKWLTARFPQAKEPAEGAGFRLRYAGEHHGVEREGNRVRLVIGVPEEEVAKLESRPH